MATSPFSPPIQTSRIIPPCPPPPGPQNTHTHTLYTLFAPLVLVLLVVVVVSAPLGNEAANLLSTDPPR
jgi:hypothetical protein